MGAELWVWGSVRTCELGVLAVLLAIGCGVAVLLGFGLVTAVDRRFVRAVGARLRGR